MPNNEFLEWRTLWCDDINEYFAKVCQSLKEIQKVLLNPAYIIDVREVCLQDIDKGV